ncbi:MAG: rRNA maturation RNase YbeY [Planctomycetales bacterium]|nr:rRNA maturation RNase YbeY [Planctomycetales bacterium]NIM08880.1 rRNA maturation RNase YbeY [Planctomycetales bacterium]NIN08340.1 rRNA maturation RNase YbeY [Planctomycetales bacterium]NIN77468.1 rRNA maturation RNase YbeY [Planctomycetales bacterium]NIO34640.1 rRNA maturation RNase YbeY [Planctomycetales bacterium]
MIHIELINETGDSSVDRPRLVNAVKHVLQRESISSAEIGIAVVDDSRIHELNVQYLGHDYPTDVLSFPLGMNDQTLQGEIAVSLDTARAEAARYGWSVQDELLLYVVHGTLHLAGYDDQEEAAASRMQARQGELLVQLGLQPRDEPLQEDVSSGGRSLNDVTGNPATSRVPSQSEEAN